MFAAGSESWRFASGIEQHPHVGLFVRDALLLEVAPGPWIPPPLGGDVPDRSALLDDERRAEVSAGWTIWWRTLLADDVRVQQGGTDERGQQARLLRLRQAAGAPIDPPHFASLAGQPALQTAVRATFEEGCRWADQHRRRWLPPVNRLFDWQLIRDTAVQVAARRRVRLGTLNACAVVLMVEGTWWSPFSPGAILCSVDAARDPGVAQEMLTAAFESGVKD